MSKLLKNTEKKAGQSPGSLIYTGDKKENGAEAHLIRYNGKDISEKIFSLKNGSLEEEIHGFRKNDEILWMNLDGIQNADAIGKAGRVFHVHPLTLEDILNISHRPKAEDNESYIFVVIKMLSYVKESRQVKSEQLSIILKENLVLTFQEDKVDNFETLRENIRKRKGRLRDSGSDYLSYRVLDTVIDDYFAVLECIGDELEILEDELLEKPSHNTLQKLYLLKNNMISIRRAVWPLREVIALLEKSDSPLIDASTRPFLRDLYDHIVQIIDTTENYREMISGMVDIYLSSTSNRLNEIMKILTIISTIFIPLNFIAGVYGMNFNTAASRLNMPELNWYYGYPAVLSVMLAVALLLVLFFRRKKWF